VTAPLRPIVAPARADLVVPPALPGMRIGLFGGSFNPPHDGHAHVMAVALQRLRLDKLWVMVTPGNPLKDVGGLPPLAERIAAVRALVTDPRVVVTGLEAGLGSAFSWKTVDRLTQRFPQTRFVWVMGGDNLASFHRWQAWWRLAHAVPMAIVDRPGATLKGMRSRAASALDFARLPEAAAPTLAGRKPPAWIYLHAPRVALSSTELRDGRLSRKG
jgi:nicotinate-nucleotide adenylyltransferase